jgi:MFS family permease
VPETGHPSGAFCSTVSALYAMQSLVINADIPLRLYLLSFLDRSNIGNAKIAGLTDDLKLSDSQYEWLLTAFYIMYILFEWMTIMYQLVPPHIYISLCVCAWGVLASLQALATSYAYLLVLRALLGIGEAAFVGIPFYLTFFFRREELAFRTGLFISSDELCKQPSMGNCENGRQNWNR